MTNPITGPKKSNLPDGYDPLQIHVDMLNRCGFVIDSRKPYFIAGTKPNRWIGRAA